MLRAAIYRLFACSCILFAMAAQAQAEEIYLGNVVSAMGNMLVASDPDGANQKTFEIPMDAVIMLNGAPAKLEEITHGDMVKVVSETKDGKTVVTHVDAKSGEVKLRPFAG